MGHAEVFYLDGHQIFDRLIMKTVSLALFKKAALLYSILGNERITTRITFTGCCNVSDRLCCYPNFSDQ